MDRLVYIIHLGVAPRGTSVSLSDLYNNNGPLRTSRLAVYSAKCKKILNPLAVNEAKTFTLTR